MFQPPTSSGDAKSRIQLLKSIDSQESMGSSQRRAHSRPRMGHSVRGGGPASMMLLLVKHQVSRAPQMNSDNFCLKRPSFVKNPSTQFFDPCLGVNPSYSVGNTMIPWYGNMSTPDETKPWFMTIRGGTPPIVMIWYLNGTLPTKQSRGLLIQGWHYPELYGL